MRMRTTIEKKDLYPLYEYVRLNVTDSLKDGSALSFYMSAWGRADLAGKTTSNETDGDLRYAYLSYRSAKNNLLVNVGRQFVSEGVAAEKFDGAYLRSDLLGGFGAAAYVGKSVFSEPDYKGGGIFYGGRVSHSMAKYYTVGLSALKSEKADGGRYREEEGVDIWIHPLEQIDLAGRTSYNSITSGFMESAYTLTITPIDGLSVSSEVSSVSYKDYFHNVTTKALSLTTGIIDPKEKMLSTGAAISYIPLKNLTVSANYKNYSYDIAGAANYFGGKVTYAVPESYSAGLSANRMEGAIDRLRYSELRLFASKILGKTTLSADYISVIFDKAINGTKNSYSITGSAGYQLTDKLRVAADLEYSRSPFMNDELRGMIKVVYAFETKFGEGGSKSEK